MSNNVQSFFEKRIELEKFDTLKIANIFEPLFKSLAEIHDDSFVIENLIEEIDFDGEAFSLRLENKIPFQINPSFVVQCYKSSKELIYAENFQAPDLAYHHHDPLTDIYTLGLVLASFVLKKNIGLSANLTDFELKCSIFDSKTHPLLQYLVKQMTALNRNDRATNLHEIAHLLKNIQATQSPLRLILSDNNINDTSSLKSLRKRLLSNNKSQQILNYKEAKSIVNLALFSDEELNKKLINLLKGKLTANNTFQLSDIVRTSQLESCTLLLDSIRLKANRDVKELGYSSLKIAPVYLSWTTFENNTQQIHNSPLLFIAISIEKSSEAKSFNICIENPVAVFNPILSYELKRIFDITLPISFDFSTQGMEELSSLIQAKTEAMHNHISISFSEKPLNTNKPLNWQLSAAKFVLGNFYYKNMSLVSDYDKFIEKNQIPDAINFLLQKEKSPQASPKKVLNFFLESFSFIETDVSQEAAILATQNMENIVIQGPPGTGKTQTIANIIADQLANNKKVLFLSEKTQALDAVKRKLDKGNLGSLASFVYDTELDKKSFVKELKIAFYENQSNPINLEAVTKRREILLKSYALLESKLQAYQALLLRIPVGSNNTSLRQILDQYLLIESAESQHITSKDSYSEFTYTTWETFGESITNVSAQLSSSSTPENSINAHPIFLIRRENMLLNKDSTILKNEIRQAEALSIKIKELLDKINSDILSNTTPNILAENQDEIGFSAYLLNQGLLTLVQGDQNESNILKFHYSKRRALEKKLRSLKIKTKHWKIKPTQSSLTNYIAITDKYESKPFAIFYADYRILRKVFKENYRAHFLDKKYNFKEALVFLEREYELIAQLNILNEDLESKYGKMPLETLLSNLVKYKASLLNSVINQVDKSKWYLLYSLDKMLLEFKHISHPINWQQEYSFISYMEHLKCLKKHLPIYQKIKDDLCKIYHNGDLINLLGEVNWKAKKIHAICTVNTMNQNNKLIDNFKNNSSKALISCADEHLKIRKEILVLNAVYVKALNNNKFHQILRNSNLSISGMNSTDRNKKNMLLEGRKLLENEFSKTRSFKSIRELFDSKALPFISNLKPIWMMSPLSVSDALPFREDLFDLVIFDEASQCRLESAIPAIYRAKQIIIVGDKMQMPPTKFFQKFDPNLYHDNLASNLLEQAGHKYFEYPLNWHYRSENNSLINFNNAAFYGNQLQILPNRLLNADNFKAVEIRQANQAAFTYQDIYTKPISFHYMKNAVFQDRKNSLESKYIAEIIKHLLLSHNELSIGVVAFSKEQELAIESELKEIRFFDKTFEDLLQEKHNKYPNFDGFILKNIERIQGEERDVIIVSVGYGFNAAQKLSMNFGPINNLGGEKRLNVLFSRAKKHILLVSSIKHGDITNDYNPGPACLKDYLKYAEEMSLGNYQKIDKFLNKMASKISSIPKVKSNLMDAISSQLQEEGFYTTCNYGYGKFEIPIAVKQRSKSSHYNLAILIDDEASLMEPSYHFFNFKKNLLEKAGWKVAQVFIQDWEENSTAILAELKDLLLPEKQIKAQKQENSIFDDKLPYNLSESDLLFTRLEQHDGKGKFWQIAGKLNDIVIRYGKIGSEGKKIIKSLNSVAEVIIEKRKLVKQKERKGYKRV
jgi:superfamily I DNA and/or RNA helicase/predicted DNA-binding WGR domain protein